MGLNNVCKHLVNNVVWRMMLAFFWEGVAIEI